MKFKIAIIALQLILLQSCIIQTVSHNSALESKIKSRLESLHPKAGLENIDLDFKSLTNFDWERLYIIEPFNNLEQLKKTAKVNIDLVKDDKIRFGRTNNFIFAFTKNNEVVALSKFPRTGDFSEVVNTKNGYSPEDAVFNICERGDSTFLGERIFKITKHNSTITASCIDEEEAADEN